MKQTLKMGAALAVLALLGTVGASQANTHADTTCHANAFNGFNIGLHGGYVGHSTKLDVTNIAAALNDSSDMGGQGFMGGLFLGWGHVFKNVHHFGIEASAKFANVEAKKNTFNVLPASLDHKVKQTSAYDLTLRYGPVVAQKVLPFIKLGVAYGQWKSSTSSALIGSGSKNNNQVGFIAGAGVEFALSNRFSMGGEYTYTYFKDFTYDVLNNAVPPVATARVKVKPSTNAFMIRAKFKIG